MLWDYWDEMYSVSVGIGSNNQQFSVLLHLGTTDFWVPSQACTTNGCAGRQNFASSSTLLCSNPPRSWSSYYLLGTPYYPAGGCASGYLANDTVNLAGITTPNVSFGLATEVDSCITNSWYDGVLGLALGSGLSWIALPGIMNDFVLDNNNDMRRIGLHHQRAENGIGDMGEISFGVANPKWFTGDLVFIASINLASWQIIIENIAVDGVEVSFQSTILTATISSITPYFTLTKADATALHYALNLYFESNGAGMYTLPCDTNVDLTFGIGGLSFSISPLDYLGPQINDGDAVGLCHSNIKGNDSYIGVGHMEIGTGFLRNVCPRVRTTVNAGIQCL